MEESIWDRSKGDYCKKENIDIHFDDGLNYAKDMPASCSFVLVGENFSIKNLLLDI